MSFNLADAFGGGNEEPNKPWPGPPAAHPTWPGVPSGGGPPGPWPQSGGGGPLPGPQFGGGNSPWAGAPSGGGSHGPWPGAPSGGGGHGPWPGAPSGGGGHGPQPGFPSGGGGHGPQPGVPSGGGFQPSRPLVVPYSLPLPNGVYDKLLITIRGTVKGHPNKFALDVHAGNDIAFHINPRFNENGQKVIVRNSFISKKWGPEERQLSQFPFAPGQPFEIKILCNSREYRVAVNNSHLFEYRHRITNLRSVNQFCIYGDVDLTAVTQETLH